MGRVDTPRHIVVLEQAYRTIYFQHSERNISDAADAMLPACPLDFIDRHVFPCKMRHHQLAVMNEQRRRSLHQFPEAAVRPTEFRDGVVQHEERYCRDSTSHQ